MAVVIGIVVAAHAGTFAVAVRGASVVVVAAAAIAVAAVVILVVTVEAIVVAVAADVVDFIVVGAVVVVMVSVALFARSHFFCLCNTKKTFLWNFFFQQMHLSSLPKASLIQQLTQYNKVFIIFLGLDAYLGPV